MDESLALNSLIHNLEEDSKLVWDQQSAIELCRMLEQVAPEFGAHVALTGGCLYKSGRRKDVDIIFYRIRQQASIDEKGLLDALVDRAGFVIENRLGWVVKARFDNKPIDLFFPEENIHQQMITSTCRHRIYPDLTRDRPSTDPRSMPTIITCPKCYKPMMYRVEHDAWIHPNAKQAEEQVPLPLATPPVVKTGTCRNCNAAYGYIQGKYEGEIDNTCPTCLDAFKQYQAHEHKPSMVTSLPNPQSKACNCVLCGKIYTYIEDEQLSSNIYCSTCQDKMINPTWGYSG